MALLRVNPTRMELKRLKARLKTAVRGHKLLKDKSDEMIRQFSLYIRQNKKLREQTESLLSSALSSFMLARSLTEPKAMEIALSVPVKNARLSCGTKSVVGVEVPQISIHENTANELFPYAFTSITAETDASITALSGLMSKLIMLAEVEKTCNMLAVEIEKNRRRVNALEYVLIPQMEENIKYITMRLEENERGNLVRLMKVKDIIAKQ